LRPDRWLICAPSLSSNVFVPCNGGTRRYTNAIDKANTPPPRSTSDACKIHVWTL
jgi:hypothetical protein